MTEYLIAFNDEWVPDLTDEDLRESVQGCRRAEGRDEGRRSPHLHQRPGRRCPCAQCRCVERPPCSPTVRTSRPRSTSAASPSWMWPTRRRRGCGRERSRWPAVGRRRGDASGTQPPACPFLRPEDAVSVFFTEVVDVAAGGLKYSQAEEAEHRDEGELELVCRLPCRGEQRLEPKMGQSEGRGRRWHVGASHGLSRGMREDVIDDAGAVEPGDYGHAARDRRSLVPAHLLKPPDGQLDVRTGRPEGPAFGSRTRR
jgi:hypothetical protein